MAVNLSKVVGSRTSEQFLWDIRSDRGTNLSAWKTRVETLDKLYRGDWDAVFPNETVQRDLPHVMNLVQVGMTDLSRLVTESLPSVRAFPATDSADAQKNAYLREAISQTYWDMNMGELLIPLLTHDLAGTGACFVSVTATEGQDYPLFTRLDPRYCFPDFYNGKLQDVLAVHVMPLRKAARMYPDLGLGDVPPDRADAVEIYEYYGPEECVQGVAFAKNGTAVQYNTDVPVKITKTWTHGLGQVPVAFAQLETFDGEIRGMFDQIAGSLRTKNRIVKLILDYTDQMTYAPLVSKGLLNPEQKPGPSTHYQLDPNVPEAQVGRLTPAGSAPQLFALLEFLDQEERGGTMQPAQRGGEVRQSIASASFVAATQGQLTSAVRNIQGLLASVREQLNTIGFKVDEKHVDREKPLSRPVARKKSYKPSTDIAGNYVTKVIYGAGAGLDRLNADVRIIQHLGARLISRETAREQLDYLDERSEEQDKIDRELGADALVQKFFTEAPWELIAQVLDEQDKGTPVSQAIRKVTAVLREQAAAQATAEPEPVQEGEAPQPATEREALEKGAIPSEGGATEPKFQGPPITQILVR